MPSLGPLYADLGVDTTGLRKAEKEVQQFARNAETTIARASKNAGNSISSFSGSARSNLQSVSAGAVSGFARLQSVLLKVGVALGTLGPAVGLGKLVKTGLEFNGVMENSQIAIASMIGSVLEITDEQGNVLKGQEAWNASQQLAAESMERIKILALETTATVPELVTGFQGIVGFAAQAGIELKDMPVVGQRLAQAMAAAQIPMQQMRTEGRAILTGHVTANDILARNLQITKKDVEEWKKKGNYTEMLLKRLEAYAFAGEAAAKTVKGLVSNLEDAVQQTTGLATAPAYDQLRKTLQGLLDNIILIDKEALEAGKGGLKLRDDWVPFQKLIADISLGAAKAFDWFVTNGVAALQAVGKGWVDIREDVFVIGRGIYDTASFLWDCANAAYAFAVELADPRNILTAIKEAVDEIRIVFWKVRAAAKAQNEDIEDLQGWYKDVRIAVEGWLILYRQVDTTTGYIADKINDYLDPALAKVEERFRAIAGLSRQVEVPGEPPLPPGAQGFDPGANLLKQFRDNQKLIRQNEKDLREQQAKSKYGTKGRPQPPKDEKGAKGAESAAKRLSSMTMAWKEEIARLAGSGMAELDAWYAKELQKITEVEKKGSDGDKARATLKQLYLAKEAKLTDDYHKWLAGATSDVLGGIALEHQELLRQYKGIKGAEEEIFKVTELKKYKYFAGMEQKRLGFASNYLQEMSSLTPVLEEQLNLQGQLLEIQHNTTRLELQRALASREITPEIYNQAMAYEALLYKARQFDQMRKGWQTEGVLGGLSEIATARISEASTRMYRTTIEVMKSVEQTVAGGLADAFIASMEGKEVDMSKIFTDIVYMGIRKGFELSVAAQFDSMYGLFRKIMGIQPPKSPMVQAGETTSFLLDNAGMKLKQYMEQGALNASMTLSSTRIPGLDGGYGGAGGGTGYGGQIGGYPLPVLSPLPTGGYGGGGYGAGMGVGAGFGTGIGTAMGGGGPLDIGSMIFQGFTQGALTDPTKLMDIGSQIFKMGAESLQDLGGGGGGGAVGGGIGKETAKLFKQGTEQFDAASAAGIASAASLGLGALSLITGSKEMQTAAMILQLAATALQIAAAISKIPFFHSGGILKAHEGLVLAQAGEGILRKRAMRSLEASYGPGAFSYLNSGELPPGGRGGGNNYSINLQLTELDDIAIDRFVVSRLVPAIRRYESRFGD